MLPSVLLHMIETARPIDFARDFLRLQGLIENMRDAIMFKNGLDWFKLPETVPALPGQKLVF